MNIMLNSYCNLKCPYCFATDEIESDCSNNMSEENFDEVLDCLTSNNIKEVRLIGGEPTLHPYFIYFIQKIISRSCFEKVYIFSNMTFNQDILDTIILLSYDINISFLPNFNERIVLQDKNDVARHNVCTLSKYNLVETIGVNIYKPDMDFSYIFNIIEKTNIRDIRWSITTPNEHISNVKEYFHKFYDTLLNFFELCRKYKCTNHIDCNSIPLCAFKDNELGNLVKKNYGFLRNCNACSVVLDVNTDLEAFRCFGMSDSFKIKIDRYSNINNIVEQIEKNTEHIANKTLFDECVECNTYLLNGCRSCACLAYRK